MVFAVTAVVQRHPLNQSSKCWSIRRRHRSTGRGTDSVLVLAFKINPILFPFPHSISEINTSTFRLTPFLKSSRLRSIPILDIENWLVAVSIPILVYRMLHVPGLLPFQYGFFLRFCSHFRTLLYLVFMKIGTGVAIQQAFINLIYILCCLHGMINLSERKATVF